MNLSRGNCETIKKYHKKVVAVVDMPHPCKIFFSPVCRFCALLISLWVNTLLTDTLIRLGLHALWVY